jgi:hypothetical protein
MFVAETPKKSWPFRVLLCAAKGGAKNIETGQLAEK